MATLGVLLLIAGCAHEKPSQNEEREAVSSEATGWEKWVNPSLSAYEKNACIKNISELLKHAPNSGLFTESDIREYAKYARRAYAVNTQITERAYNARLSGADHIKAPGIETIRMRGELVRNGRIRDTGVKYLKDMFNRAQTGLSMFDKDLDKTYEYVAAGYSMLETNQDILVKQVIVACLLGYAGEDMSYPLVMAGDYATKETRAAYPTLKRGWDEYARKYR